MMQPASPDNAHTCEACDYGCPIHTWCDGCDRPVCNVCWLEHNADGPCHDDGVPKCGVQDDQ